MSCEKICNNCKLFNPETSRCSVTVLYGGEKFNLPVEPNDTCFFQNQFVAHKSEFNSQGELEGESTEFFKPQIQEVKWWVEDPETGETTNGDGVVKIQYPEGFFAE